MQKVCWRPGWEGLPAREGIMMRDGWCLGGLEAMSGGGSAGVPEEARLGWETRRLQEPGQCGQWLGRSMGCSRLGGA